MLSEEESSLAHQSDLFCDPAEGKTRQSEAEEADINRIMRRYEQTGELPVMKGKSPVYGDFANVEDYLSACLRVKAAEVAFLELPARVRARVNNDPGEFLAWALDPKNLKELQELGLAVPAALQPPPPPAPTDPVVP